MLINYTGDGKGKTTSSFGIILRSLVLGKRVLLVQFMKPDKEKSILFFEGAFPKFKSINYGITGFFKKGEVPKELINICKYGFETLKTSYQDYDLIVVDELFTAIYFELLDKKDVLECLKHCIEPVDVVLTGRKCSKEFIDMADIVTEMKQIKHHYDKGIQAKQGIDF